MAKDTDVDQDLVPDVLEQNKIALENVKHAHEVAFKERQQKLAEKTAQDTKELKDRELKIKERIQKAKDAAAKQRELIKARTSLKNPTSGEKK